MIVRPALPIAAWLCLCLFTAPVRAEPKEDAPSKPAVRKAPAAPVKPSLKYQPTPDDERPMPTVVTIGPQDGNLAVQVEFDRVPWGEECKVRCANATFFLDLDGNKATGLQMGKTAAETGADVAISIVGTREYRELSADTRLRVKMRQFPQTATRVEEGQSVGDLDLARDPGRLRNEGKVVFILIDIAQVDAPAGRRMRVVFHPAGASAIQGEAPGMLAGEAKTRIFPKS